MAKRKARARSVIPMPNLENMAEVIKTSPRVYKECLQAAAEASFNDWKTTGHPWGLLTRFNDTRIRPGQQGNASKNPGKFLGRRGYAFRANMITRRDKAGRKSDLPAFLRTGNMRDDIKQRKLLVAKSVRNFSARVNIGGKVLNVFGKRQGIAKWSYAKYQLFPGGPLRTKPIVTQFSPKTMRQEWDVQPQERQFISKSYEFYKLQLMPKYARRVYDEFKASQK